MFFFTMKPNKKKHKKINIYYFFFWGGGGGEEGRGMGEGEMDGQTNSPKPIYPFNFFEVGG